VQRTLHKLCHGLHVLVSGLHFEVLIVVTAANLKKLSAPELRNSDGVLSYKKCFDFTHAETQLVKWENGTSSVEEVYLSKLYVEGQHVREQK
jgi:hypothetical protein